MKSLSRKQYAELVQRSLAPRASTKSAAVKNIEDVDLESRTIKFVISTDAVDADNSRIMQDNWDLSAYELNPVVLWDHNTSLPPIGKCIGIGVESGKLKATVCFVPADNPANGAFADGIYKQILGGFIHATSVGFLITDQVIDQERSDEYGPALNILGGQLREFSIVSVPSNPECVIEPGERDARVEQAPIVAEQAPDQAAEINTQTERSLSEKALRSRMLEYLDFLED